MPPPHPKPELFSNPLAALRAHWPLYVYEAAELAAFMISACVFDYFIFGTGLHLNPWLARLLMGASMGGTAVLIIKSPWGKASGAQFNPAISVTFYRLGKIGTYDTVFYCLSHFVGAIAGVGVCVAAMGARLAQPRVNYVITVPGLGGTAGAFAAEFAMAALLITVVLYTSNRERLAPYTTWLVGLLITSYVIFLAPVSGFSINPARTVGSAVWAHVYTALWVYFVAPTASMLLAAELYTRVARGYFFPPHVRQYFSHRHLVQRNELKQ